jgi:hypothetical protein
MDGDAKSPESRGRHFGVVVDLIDMASPPWLRNWATIGLQQKSSSNWLLQKKHTKHQTPSAFYPTLGPFPSLSSRSPRHNISFICTSTSSQMQHKKNKQELSPPPGIMMGWHSMAPTQRIITSCGEM